MKLRALVLTSLFIIGCEGTGNAPDRPNAQGCQLVPGSLIITELFQDPMGPDTGREWFEIYNPTAEIISLYGVTFQSGAGVSPKVHRVPAALDTMIEPGEYLTIGNGPLGSENGIPGYSWPQLQLANTQGRIVIMCEDVEVDCVEYGKDMAGPGKPREGISWQLAGSLIGPNMDPAINDIPGNWCESTDMPIFSEEGDQGSPGAANGNCPIPGQCNDNGTWRPLVRPILGDLVITEVFANNLGKDDKAKEWFEIYSHADVDLNDLLFEHESTGIRSWTVASETCVSIKAGAYEVLGGSQNPQVNGGIESVLYAFPSGLELYNKEATLTIKDAEEEILHVASHPTSGTKGGVSVQLMPGLETDHENAADPENWCFSTTEGLFEEGGSPGVANDPCAED